MKKISNWFIGVWISFCSLLQLWPESMLYIWSVMPDDMKMSLDAWLVKSISYSILVISMLAKMHAMKKAAGNGKN